MSKTIARRPKAKDWERLPPANAPRQLIERIFALCPEHGDYGEFVRTALTREAERREHTAANMRELDRK